MIRYKRFFKERRNFNWPPFAEMEGSLRRPLPAGLAHSFLPIFLLEKVQDQFWAKTFRNEIMDAFTFITLQKGLMGF